MQARWIFVLMILIPAMAAAVTSATVRIDSESFNPSAGQSLPIEVTLSAPAVVIVRVVDINGDNVKPLVLSEKLPKGKTLLSWDGSTERRDFPAHDGVYFIRIFEAGLPLDQAPPDLSSQKSISINANYYDKYSGALSYTLTEPSIVLVEAGRKYRNSQTGSVEKKVLKTITNREPRARGMVHESWTGHSESGEYIAGNDDFFVTIGALPLGKNSVIVYGGKNHTGGGANQ